MVCSIGIDQRILTHIRIDGRRRYICTLHIYEYGQYGLHKNGQTYPYCYTIYYINGISLTRDIVGI